MVFSTNYTGKTGYLYAKNEFGPLPHTQHIKVNSKWITDRHVRATIMKLLGENLGVTLCDFCHTVISWT